MVTIGGIVVMVAPAVRSRVSLVYPRYPVGIRWRPRHSRSRYGNEGTEVELPALVSGTSGHLLAARDQMAISLGFHIVLSCFGVAFPTLIYLVHRRGLRGDPDAL